LSVKENAKRLRVATLPSRFSQSKAHLIYKTWRTTERTDGKVMPSVSALDSDADNSNLWATTFSFDHGQPLRCRKNDAPLADACFC
jgi:hypothetical protein